MFEGEKLFSEPVRRTDGTQVRLHVNRDVGTLQVQTQLSPGSGFFEEHYPVRDVVRLGEGSFSRGALRIGQAYYKASPQKAIQGRLLENEIAASRRTRRRTK